MFENRALRKIFRQKRSRVTAEWRKLCNKELYDLYLTKYNSGDQIKKKEMGMAFSR